MKPIKPLAARVGPANLKLGKQPEGKPAKIATGPRTTLATETPSASREQTFGQAFAAGRAAADKGGSKTFTYKGKSYSTARADDKKSAAVTSTPATKKTYNLADDVEAQTGKLRPPTFKTPEFHATAVKSLTNPYTAAPTRSPNYANPKADPSQRFKGGSSGLLGMHKDGGPVKKAKCGTKVKPSKKK